MTQETSNKSRFLSKTQGIVFLTTILTFLLKAWSRSHPETVEKWYTNGFYDGVRWVFDLLTGWLPFAFIYLVFCALLVLIIVRVKKWWAIPSWKSKLLKASTGVVTLLAVLYTSFTWLWGFNYEKTSFSQKHQLQTIEIADSILFQDLEELSFRLSEKRQSLGLPDSITWDMLPRDLDYRVRSALNDGLSMMGYDPKGKLRAKLLHPRGSLLRISTAGIFLPFSGEGHVDPGLHPIMIPFVMAHEMSHAQGFTNEGVCNFVAYHTMSHSVDPLLSYCGSMGYFRYLASQCRRMDVSWYKTFFENLDPLVKNDLIHISAYSRKYPDILPKLRDLTYDTYLKAQGIQDGMKSYNTVVRLHYQWQRNQEVKRETINLE